MASNRFCVYDRNGDYFPPIEAEEVEVTDTGVTFYNDHGVPIAHFERDAITGFQPEEPVRKDEETARTWMDKMRKRYTCPHCGAYAPYQHNGVWRCQACGEELPKHE